MNKKSGQKTCFMGEETLSVVIPAKNERGTIGEVIDRVEKEVSPYFSEVKFVISSSSSDGTDSIAENRGAEVIRDGGRGLGEAMYRGLKKAAELDTDYIMTIDSDLQFIPEEASRLIEAREDADLVLGSRFLEDGVEYQMSLSHRFGNSVLTRSLKWFAGIDITDAQTGYRLMRSEVAEELRMTGRHTYVQETIIDAYHNGFTVHEVPVSFAERQEGGSKVVSSITKYAFRTLPVILHRTNMTAYLMNGAALLAAAISVVFLLLSFIQRNMMLAGVGIILFLVSMQTLFIGMFIDGETP
jgi:glycosyltransferase involved in cell wall biosynthesis